MWNTCPGTSAAAEVPLIRALVPASGYVDPDLARFRELISENPSKVALVLVLERALRERWNPSMFAKAAAQLPTRIRTALGQGKFHLPESGVLSSLKETRDASGHPIAYRRRRATPSPARFGTPSLEAAWLTRRFREFVKAGECPKAFLQSIGPDPE